MHDWVLRNANIVDGTGAPARIGDVALEGDRIASVGGQAGPGRREIDAEGRLLTPGFVDIHTHYDGQATWDSELSPSSGHGVTTVVMGNCGVGFAPARPDEHDFLIGLMEGVEDIPGAALAEGIRWDWESFPEYLDALETLPRVADVGTQVPHGAVRAYVMGERGARNEPATPEDIAAMAALVGEGIRAGALGFSTSRTILHRAVDGEPVPGTFAAEDELMGLGQALRDAGAGVFELAPAGAGGEDLAAPEREMAWMRKLAAHIDRPVTFVLTQNDADPKQWRRLLALAREASAAGAPLVAQVAARPTSLLLGLESSIHPFFERPTYLTLADLPLAERVARLRDPAVRARILAEESQHTVPIAAFIAQSFHKLFPLGDPPDYEPAPERCVTAIAEREGLTPEEVAYDLLLQRDGRELLYFPLLNYSDGDFEAVRTMLLHENACLGLSDGGAHCGVMCDASMPTFLLTHWVRDRERGERLPLEWAVRRMTRDTAALYGLGDRGVLAPGMKADLNLIDLDALSIEPPEMVRDLPGQGRRLLQRARGYAATFAAGELTFEDGAPTGARPGRVLRGARPAPA